MGDLGRELCLLELSPPEPGHDFELLLNNHFQLIILLAHDNPEI